MRIARGLAMVLGVGLLAAQQPAAPPVEGARDLFFAGAAPRDELPAIHKAPAGSKAATAPQPAAPSGASAIHLGIRYTLLLVSSRSGVGEPVDPARNFKNGDCVAINLESNRSGYLYVLARESGGDWTPLFPTPELADQDNRIDPGQVVRTPKQSCFEIDDPPGTETLFVVLSRAPRDIYELSESLRFPRDKAQAAATQRAEAAPVKSVVEQMTAQYGTRDLQFKEVVKPASAPPPVRKGVAGAVAHEPRHAVYVVNGTAKGSATLVTRIEISHR